MLLMQINNTIESLNTSHEANEMSINFAELSTQPTEINQLDATMSNVIIKKNILNLEFLFIC